MKLLHSMLCVALLSFSSAATAGLVYFTESDPISAKVGDDIVLHARGQGFPIGVDGGGLNITFDRTRLQLNSVTVDSLWNDLFDNGSVDNSAGKVTDIFFNDFSPQGVSGDFPILSLQFSAIGGGAAFIEAEANAKFPFAGGGRPLAAEFSKLEAIIESASPVPEPSTPLSLLAGLALVTLLGAAWRLRGPGAH